MINIHRTYAASIIDKVAETWLHVLIVISRINFLVSIIFIVSAIFIQYLRSSKYCKREFRFDPSYWPYEGLSTMFLSNFYSQPA